MQNLSAPSTRAYNGYCRKMAKKAEEKAIAFSLVLEEVHPSNLGVLPPNPVVLLDKAVQLGLLESYSL